MKKNISNLDINEGPDLMFCKYIGEGHNGKIYRMTDGRIIKIYKDFKAGRKEYSILMSLNGNPHFPKVYECGFNYMIRDYVDGQCLKDYIRKNGIDKVLAMSIINLMEEFKTLNFSKVDIRCKDIFVQNNGNLMVIDPKSTYTRERHYPHKLMKGLSNVNALDTFIQVLKKERPDLYKRWIINGRNLEPPEEDKEIY